MSNLKNFDSRKKSVKPDARLAKQSSRSQVDNAAKKRKHGEQKANDSNQPANKRRKKDQSFNLLDEIKALGGDESDLKLIEDVASESEQEGGSEQGDQALQKELTIFAKGLGFENFTSDAQASEEEEEDEHDGTNSDISSGGEDEEAISEPELPPRELQDMKREKVVLQPRPDWFNEPAASDPKLPSPNKDDIAVYNNAINSLKMHARSVWERDALAYASSRAAKQSHKVLSTFMTSGTMSDKVSALTLAIQESPLHNAKALETLVSLASKRSRNQALAALGAIVDFFGPGLLLPPTRRLRPFHSQPGLLGSLQAVGAKSWRPGSKLPGRLTEAHLVCWFFEDWLKEMYFRIIQLLETWLNDEVEFSRTRALDFVFALLREKPEQESNLLRLVVHKLGDLHSKIASRASYCLLQLLETHPAMKKIVVKSIEHEIMLRPSQTIRAKYYAAITLNQIVLSPKEPEIADLLQELYFAVFVSVLKMQKDQPEVKKVARKSLGRPKKNTRQSKPDASDQPATETADKLVSALLTGVNRAVPYSNTDNSTLESYMDTLFRIAHSSNFNTSIQALLLIQQIASSRSSCIDRYFRTLYESLLDPRLVTSSKQTLYLNLLYKSLKSDTSTLRVKAFVKRIMQVCILHAPPFICGAIYLVIEIAKQLPDLCVLIDEPETHGEEGSTLAVEGDKKAKVGYDGRKRDPEYSNAHESCLWEVLPLLSHFHPSVSLFASALLAQVSRHGLASGSKNETEQQKLQRPDMTTLTQMHFLDKFVFRNPKTNATADGAKGASIMQPAGSTFGVNLLDRRGGLTMSTHDVNTPSFWNKKLENVGAEDVFFHSYFSLVGKQRDQKENRPARRAIAGAGKEENEDGGSFADSDEEKEQEIWNALVNSRPEIEADISEGFSDEDGGDLDSLSDYTDSDENDVQESSTVSLQLRQEVDQKEGNDDDGVDLDPAFFDSDDVDATQRVKGKGQEAASVATDANVDGDSGSSLVEPMLAFSDSDNSSDIDGMDIDDEVVEMEQQKGRVATENMPRKKTTAQEAKFLLQQWGGRKRKGPEGEEKTSGKSKGKNASERRRLLRNLPVFATADEYDELLGMEEGLDE